MSNLNTRVLDPLTHLQQFDANSGKVRYVSDPLTLFGWAFLGQFTDGCGKNAPLPKICHTYPTMMKLGTVIPYLKEIQALYE